MNIDYNTLSEDQLEEFVEFIDWSLVPSHLLTEDIKKRFSFIFKGLQVRLWLEELLFSFEAKIDEEKYPGTIFFFKKDKWYMDLDLDLMNRKKGKIWCSRERIWTTLGEKISCDPNERKRFIKNIMASFFKSIEIISVDYFIINRTLVEEHFKIEHENSL